MEAKEREQVRAYVGAGLQSLWQDNTEDAQGNVMWAQLALQDLTQAKLLLPAQELAALDKTLEKLGRTPKLAANAQDSLLDLEGVRCYDCGRFLIFYRYNAGYDLVAIVRLAWDQPAWQEQVRDGREKTEPQKS